MLSKYNKAAHSALHRYLSKRTCSSEIAMYTCFVEEEDFKDKYHRRKCLFLQTRHLLLQRIEIETEIYEHDDMVFRNHIVQSRFKKSFDVVKDDYDIRRISSSGQRYMHLRYGFCCWWR